MVLNLKYRFNGIQYCYFYCGSRNVHARVISLDGDHINAGLITIEKRIAQLHAIDVTVVITAIIDIHFIQFSRAKFI